MIDFFFWGEVEVLNIRDAFSKMSVLDRIRRYEMKDDGNISQISQSSAIVRSIIKNWIGVFGCPRVIFKDPDPRFDAKGLGDMCENFHIALISTPARHHQISGRSKEEIK